MYSKKHAHNFFETYSLSISPKLKDIDTFVRCSNPCFDITEVADILYLTTEEVRSIMEEKDIRQLDRKSFFIVMSRGSSDICRLFKRELDCGSPYLYTKEDISYIYSLDPEIVNKACEDLRIKELTSYMLPELFSHIAV
jgi:hypothetical protein